MAEHPTIKGHHILRLLGQGGMGRVYLAEDETLGRRTAIKVLSERFSADKEARARFLREARSMATVEDPHVVRVYSFGESEGAAYLVMEYVEGEMLSERIKREGPLPVGEALRITRAVVDGLDAAWEKRLVHRDIKPSNILLDTKGQVHVADFGLAKPIEADSDPSLTASGSILGTPHYLSPEQARGRSVDFRSDIYSLGIVFYEMLAGRRPYEGATPFEVVAKHIQEPLPPLREKRPELPEAVAQLDAWMTAKESAARPESYAALRAAIDAALRGEPATEAPTSTLGRAGLREAPGRRTPLLAGVAALAAVLVALWFFWRSPQGPSPAAESRLVVAVTPFHGPDEDSTKEGRVMAALVEKAITERLRGDDVKVLGVEETKQPVRDHAAARALGERLGANLVVWGESLVLRGEAEVQPYFTLVKRAPSPGEPGAERPAALGRDPLEALKERTGGSVVVGAQAPNQIELRRIGAAGVGDLVLVLAGVHALYSEGRPEKALGLFTQAPRSGETLRYRAEALLQLKKTEAAQKALEEAAALDPKDAQAWGSLGDLHVGAGRFAAAVAAYRSAAESGRGYATRQAILFEGKLYAKETYPSPKDPKTETFDSSYLLALDPDSGAVRERHRILELRSLSPGKDGLEVTYREGGRDFDADNTVTLSGGRLARPVSLGASLLLRRRSETAGRVLPANFFAPGTEGGFKLQGDRGDIPKTLPDLEAALRHARERDPTQPWHLFFLGQAQWWQERRDEAAATWKAMFAGEYPAIPYYEYAWMATDFEQLGQQAWADRAFEEALARRKRLPQPIATITLIERLINAPMLRGVAERWAAAAPSEADLERGHLWLVRARELGPVGEMDDFAAAAWASYYRRRGETVKADSEWAFRDRMRRAPANWTQEGARWDYAFQLYVTATLALSCCLVVLLRAAHRRRGPVDRRGWPLVGGFRYLTSKEHGVLLAACGLTLLGFTVLAFRTRYIEALASIPIGGADSLDSPAIIRELERRLAETPTDEIRFVAAGANYLAGRTERARLLYEALPGDPRARKDLEALRSGALSLPEPVRLEALAAAYTALPWRTWLASLWRGTATLSELGVGERVSQVLAALNAWNALLGLSLVTCLLMLPVRSGGVLSATRLATDRSRFDLVHVPGISELREGSPWRGYAALALFLFAVVAVVVHAAASWSAKFPCPGFLTAAALPSVARNFPVPALPFWPLFWTYADAPYFWAAAGLAAAASVGLRLTRPRVEAASAGPQQEAADQTRTKGQT